MSEAFGVYPRIGRIKVAPDLGRLNFVVERARWADARDERKDVSVGERRCRQDAPETYSALIAG